MNDKRADLGDKVSIGDNVYIDGKKINIDADNEIKILIYNKPLGEESTKASNTKKTVFDNLPKLKIGRWIALGRLDINTTGLLLFCNNGNLADKIIHPRNNLDREYLARIRGKPKRKELDKLLAGIKIEGNLLKFTDIVKGRETTSHTWFAMVIKEGKNRAVRKLWRDSEASMRAKTNFIFANYGYGDASSIDVKNLKITIDSPLEILKIFN